MNHRIKLADRMKVVLDRLVGPFRKDPVFMGLIVVLMIEACIIGYGKVWTWNRLSSVANHPEHAEGLDRSKNNSGHRQPEDTPGNLSILGVEGCDCLLQLSDCALHLEVIQDQRPNDLNMLHCVICNGEACERPQISLTNILCSTEDITGSECLIHVAVRLNEVYWFHNCNLPNDPALQQPVSRGDSERKATDEE